MAFNKNKALDNALKFLNQGKIAQAIGEYQQILRVDPRDQATLMTVGDLFARQGEMPQAIEYFERLAQVYLNDGFNSKAIAIYKKIAKLAPAELPPLERLADLYVQQGVMSEARPLFLQIAEAHLKANRAPKAVEVLNRLLAVEPENPRVQMRLAELYNVMGKKKEAGQTYLAYAQRLLDREEPVEAQKLIDRALEVDPSNTAFLLKAKILVATDHSDQAIAILEKHPEADDGKEVTNLILELEVKSGQTKKAAERARKQLARGHNHFASLLMVADAMLDGGKAAEALPLLRELRVPMIEAGEQDLFLHSLTSAAEKLPGQTEPLEMLADFCRHTSDPFRLNAALSQLSDAYANVGNLPRAEELLQELVDRNKNDERLVQRLSDLRAGKTGGTEEAAAQWTGEEQQGAEAQNQTTASAPPAIAEAPLDEETQKYISQALTDVDLFSSYGLTQKATHLLESVLERAPRHTPTLERLLDMYLGAGNERRTAELASQLEQIHRERGDSLGTERFAELRQRFQTAAGVTSEDLKPAPAARTAIDAASVGAVPVDEDPVLEVSEGPAEFEVPVAAHEPEQQETRATAPRVTEKPAPTEARSKIGGEELDLSDEWAAMGLEEETVIQAGPEPIPTGSETAGAEEAIEIVEESGSAPSQPVAESAEAQSITDFEILEEAVIAEAPAESQKAQATPQEEVLASESALETQNVLDEDFELLLSPEPAGIEAGVAAVTTEELINQLVAELDDLEAPAAMTAASQEKTAHITGAAASNGASRPAEAAGKLEDQILPETSAETLNELAEVFQEFRSEMGDLGEDGGEDLETHYNLGIAYREMGLLDEAIGEFQKVAKAIQKGKPFAYAMNCSTLLALTFMDKGEPKIASFWYERALEVPGLDPETILALRYDLAVSLETAGESGAALDSFRQVYAMNIDYRDVAGHIAVLQKT